MSKRLLEGWTPVTNAKDFWRKGSGRDAPRIIFDDGVWVLLRSENAPIETYPTAEDAFAAELETVA